MKFIIPDAVIEYSISLLDMEIASEMVRLGDEECVFIVEHQGLYSAGRSYDMYDFIGQCDYPIYYSKRGGRVTVHNPGQVVVYPIINLRERNMDVSTYVLKLENWIIKVLQEFNIESELSEEGIGVWVKGSKIGFIGIRIERGVATHGLCLNVNNDLLPFERIIPCGIDRVSITSMSCILQNEVNIKEVKKCFEQTFDSVFDREGGFL